MTYKLITEEELRIAIRAANMMPCRCVYEGTLTDARRVISCARCGEIATLRAVMEREGPKFRCDLFTNNEGTESVPLYTLPDEDKK